ncbi:hypothetical protein QVD99_006068 [Batrachochytrium dendrobatidis]|nr:hypothetical protein O5D80_006258 [Batrachochytrium dendrobatidis]KAK5667474.1 hypothetical protein QVD99_006068 [Batrachochytrium dendrobatidis]
MLATAVSIDSTLNLQIPDSSYCPNVPVFAKSFARLRPHLYGRMNCRVHGVVVGQLSKNTFVLDDSTAIVKCILSNELLHLPKVKTHLIIGACVQVLGLVGSENNIQCSGICFITDPALEMLCDLQALLFTQYDALYNEDNHFSMVPTANSEIKLPRFEELQYDESICKKHMHSDTNHFTIGSNVHAKPASTTTSSVPFRVAMFSNALSAATASKAHTAPPNRASLPTNTLSTKKVLPSTSIKSAILSLLNEHSKGCTSQDLYRLLATKFDATAIDSTLEEMQEDWMIFLMGDQFMKM